jgi:hypothetical protein
VTGEEALDALQALGADAEPRALGDEEAAAEPAAEGKARQVTQRGAQPCHEEQRGQLGAALCRHHAADHDRRLPGHQQAHEGAGLEQREARDERVRPGAEGVGEVGQRSLDVRRADDARGEQRDRRHRDRGGDRGPGAGEL